MYLVYLFDAEMETVSLSLNQGVTDVVDRYGTREGRRRLAHQAAAIRTALGHAHTSDLTTAIDLKSRADLPLHYEYGNIVARTYELANLPDNATLEADLLRLVHLYQAALRIRDALRLTTTDTIVTTSSAISSKEPDPVFKPKSHSEYIQHIASHTLIKSRKHEKLIKDYGRFVTSRGYIPATNVHPRDLVATKRGEHWLAEAKILHQGDGVRVTREAFSSAAHVPKVLVCAGPGSLTPGAL
jgi:hypothetical protein